MLTPVQTESLRRMNTSLPLNPVKSVVVEPPFVRMDFRHTKPAHYFTPAEAAELAAVIRDCLAPQAHEKSPADAAPAGPS